MDERTRRLAERVKLELGEHLDDADRHGSAYVDGYVKSLTGPGYKRPPIGRLHPRVAELVRELALDAAGGDAVTRRR